MDSHRPPNQEPKKKKKNRLRKTWVVWKTQRLQDNGHEHEVIIHTICRVNDVKLINYTLEMIHICTKNEKINAHEKK